MTTTTSCTFDIQCESIHDRHAIDGLLDEAFGLGRRTKTAYRLREGSQPVEQLCLTARVGGLLVGSIQFWPLTIGGHTPALLLGPLAVSEKVRGKGCGLALMREGLDRAAKLGHELVILVGDEPYYARAGFIRVPDDQLIMPGYVDPERLLAKELRAGALKQAHGLVRGGASTSLAVPGQSQQA